MVAVAVEKGARVAAVAVEKGVRVAAEKVVLQVPLEDDGGDAMKRCNLLSRR